jgi:hypothetical protein
VINSILQKSDDSHFHASSTSKEEIPQDPYNSNRTLRSVPAKTSTIDIFDDKIAALTTSKNQCVENENYVEAEKLKQIITKIEKLKKYITKLEMQKFEHANNENYDQAKKLKNEIDRIKNVVLSITSGGNNVKPKIIPPSGNIQEILYKTNNKVNQDQAVSVRAMNSYEDFRLNTQKHNPNTPNYADNEAMAIKQQNFANLKSSNNPYKLSGILKSKGANVNLDYSLASALDQSVVNQSAANSSVNISYQEEYEQKDDIYSNDTKKHVRIIDPKANKK